MVKVKLLSMQLNYCQWVDEVESLTKSCREESWRKTKTDTDQGEKLFKSLIFRLSNGNLVYNVFTMSVGAACIKASPFPRPLKT